MTAGGNHRIKKQDATTSSSTSTTIPANVRAGQVIGLVEITGSLGSPIDLSKLADEFAANLETLLPILDTAEMLGLIKSEKGDISLTEFGLKFHKATRNKVGLLRDVLAKIEPFKTAVELASKEKHASAREIAEALLARDLRWHHSHELNEALIKDLLIHWAIYAKLLKYDGRTGKFQKV